MKVALPILMAILISHSTFAARTSQVIALIGQDTPDEGEARTGSATLFRFALTTKPSMFRFMTSFTGAIGSSFQQGDLGFGFQLYPLAFKTKSYVQPYISLEGTFGVGSLNSKSRTDAGYELGAGFDIKMGRSNSGINFSISSRNATETSTRLWLGWFSMI